MNYKKANIMLWITAIVWGVGFVATRIAVDEGLTVFEFITIRFGIGVLFINTLFYRKLLTLTKEEIKSGIIIGSFLFLGFAFQTLGLTSVTPSVAAFVTATYVVIVPFIDRYIYKKSVDIYDGIGAALMLIGLGLITIADDFSINLFMLPVIACAVFYAFQVCYTGMAVQKHDAVKLSIVMFDFVFAVSLICAITQDVITKRPPVITLRAILWLLFCSVFCTFIAFLFQNIAQKYVNATKVAVILSMESVFALIASVILYKENVTLKTLIGGGVIFCAIILCQTKLGFLDKIKNSFKRTVTDD